MKIIQAKVNRLLQEPLLDRQLRTCLILSTASLGLAKGDEAKFKKRKFNKSLDSFIERVCKNRKENNHGKTEREMDLQPGPGGHLPELRKLVSGAAS